uniref:MARCKS-related protein n=1 Tax=Nannospalax galili TaxID=1026970 RepID=A0A8C6RA38_NANGA
WEGDVTPEEANEQENGHMKSNGDLSPKGEGESPPTMDQTDEAAGAAGDTIKPAPPSQGAEAKGETPKKKKFSFKKAFNLSSLSFKRNQKEGGGNSFAPSPTEEEQEQGEISACSDEGTAQEGKAAATPESQEPQAKGAEARDAEEEAGPQAAELSTPSGGPASASTEQIE